MKTKTITTYSIKELSEEARDHAYYDWIEGHEYPWAKENQDTLEAFAKIFPVNIRDWSYGGRGEGVTFDMTCDDNIAGLSGLRLATYIQNNYGYRIFTPKFIGSLTRKKFTPVYSKITREASCPLTGYIADHYILDPIYDFLQKPDNVTTFKELIHYSLDSWIKRCNEDSEATSSMEFFEEEAEANEWEYDENGRII